MLSSQPIQAPVQAPGPNAPKPSASGCVWPRPAKSCFGRVLPWTSGGDGATSAGPPMVPHAVLARQFSWLTIISVIAVTESPLLSPTKRPPVAPGDDFGDYAPPEVGSGTDDDPDESA